MKLLNSSCPACEKGILKREKISFDFLYNRKTFTAKDLNVYKCDLCGEILIKPDENKIFEDSFKEITST